MKPHPKPEPRKKEKGERRQRLADHHLRQMEKAIDRDGGLCQICLDKGVEEGAWDVHHIFGRASKASSWREDYTALMCVCRSCHPAPLYSHDWSSDHEIVVLARKINEREANR